MVLSILFQKMDQPKFILIFFLNGILKGGSWFSISVQKNMKVLLDFVVNFISKFASLNIMLNIVILFIKLGDKILLQISDFNSGLRKIKNSCKGIESLEQNQIFKTQYL